VKVGIWILRSLDQRLWPLLSALLAPVLTVPHIASQDPFSFTYAGRTLVVESVSPFGRTTAVCVYRPYSPEAPDGRYVCPMTRPIPSTYGPALLYLLAGAWLFSAKPVMREAAGVALGLAALQVGVLMVVDLQPIELRCGSRTGCEPPQFWITDAVLAILLWTVAAGVVAAILSRRDTLAPAPAPARGASAWAAMELAPEEETSTR
jgi:hypothetical protein